MIWSFMMKRTAVHDAPGSASASPGSAARPGQSTSRWRRHWRLFAATGVVLAGLLIAMCLSSVYHVFAAQPVQADLWNSVTPSNPSADDSNAVELGVRFTADVDGAVYGIRFYKGAGNSGKHTGSLWSANGHRLATATFTHESQSGWQQVNFSQPVAIYANTPYVASYFAPHGHYAYTYYAMDASHTVGDLTALQNGGVYKYKGGFPSQTYLATNYWVDVLFAPQASTQAQPTATTQPTVTTQPTITAQPTATAQPTVAATPSPSTGSGSTPPQGACASFSACGFPDVSTTGVPTGTHLTPESGNISINDDNTVINGVDLSGSFDVYANNVTIENSRITSTNWWGINLRQGYSNLKILHCTITGVPGKGLDNGGEDYGISNMGDGSIEVAYNNISLFGDQISMGTGNVHDNYVHDIQPFVALDGNYEHTDDLISDGGNSVPLIIHHNTFINQTTTEKGASASVGLFADTGNVTQVTVDDNWIAGGSYALYCGGAGSTYIKVTNNVFSTEIFPSVGTYGPVAYWNAGGAGNVFSGNIYSDGSSVSP
jgi:hypothetical protein